MKANTDSALYKRLLGNDYHILPYAVRKLHDLQKSKCYTGIATVKRGTNIFARMIAAMFSLPRSADNIPLTVKFEPDNCKERWSRNFHKDHFASTQWIKNNLLYERISIITFAFKPIVSDDSLSLKLEHVYVLGLPLPTALRPKIITRETESKGKFCFYDHVSLPLIGLLITYHGTLEESEMEHDSNPPYITRN